MFLDNKYARWYFDIIAEARSNPPKGYAERHHIVPRSLGGSNDAANLVKLTARQHFVAHELLVKMTSGKAQRSMSYALYRMVHGRQKDVYVISALAYERARKAHSKATSVTQKGRKLGHPSPLKGRTSSNKGRPSPKKGRKWDHPSPAKGRKLGHPSPLKGRKLPPRTAEHQMKINTALKGKKHTPEQRKAKSERQLGKKHRPHKKRVRSEGP